MSRGLVYIISAPSGAGKTSLVNALLKADTNAVASISYTTRGIRPGERDGVEYHFVDQCRFEAMITEGGFLEYAKVFERFYGTSRDWVTRRLAQGLDVILEIDWQGARQIRTAMPQCASIFILPPSYHDLERRLTRRGEDGMDVIQRRMRGAVNEMSHYDEYDYLLVNDDFEQALADLQAILRAGRRQIVCQRRSLAPLLQELLAQREPF